MQGRVQAGEHTGGTSLLKYPQERRFKDEESREFGEVSSTRRGTGFLQPGFLFGDGRDVMMLYSVGEAWYAVQEQLKCGF